MDYELLRGYGLDCKRGIARCLNDEELYKSMLLLFLEDDTFQRA